MSNLDMKVEREKTNHNVGIDLLRLLAMFYIVIHHICGHGGLRNDAVGIKNDIVWLICSIEYCGVNIYAIISGYVGYNAEIKQFKSSKLVKMWLQVFFYSFGITLIAFILRPESVELKSLIKSFFPIATTQYWYFTAYAGILILKPRLNCFISRLTDKEMTVFSILIFGLFSIYSLFASLLGGDPFKLSDGQSFLWLLILYFIGSWLKKCDIAKLISNKCCLITILSCNLITWVARRFVPSILGLGNLISYISPTMVLSAIAYVILFSNLRVSEVLSKIVNFLAPAAFGVYLVHNNFYIRKFFINGSFVWIASSQAWKIPLLIVWAAFVIYFLCIVIEEIRLFLFEKLKINGLIRNIGNAVDNLLLKLHNMISSKLKKYILDI